MAVPPTPTAWHDREVDAPTLRTERLVAWPLGPDDIDEVAALWADRTVMAHIAGGVRDRALTLDRLRADADHWQRHGWGPWAFRRTTTGALVGEGGCRPVDPLDDGGTAEFSIVCGKRWWGRGLAAEAATAALTELWRASRVQRVTASIDPDHAAGRALVARLGFQARGERTTAGATREIWVLDRPSG